MVSATACSAATGACPGDRRFYDDRRHCAQGASAVASHESRAVAPPAAAGRTTHRSSHRRFHVSPLYGTLLA